VLLAVFVTGLGVTGYISYELLHKNARDEVLRNAGVMLEASLSMRQLHDRQGAAAAAVRRRQVPARERAGVRRDGDHEPAAQEVPRLRLQGGDAEPDQPRDRRSTGRRTSSTPSATRPRAATSRESAARPTGRSLYLARPLQIRDQACLSCHTTAEMAPPAMVKLYGPNNGFRLEDERDHRRADRLGAMDLPIRNANHAFVTFMSSLTVVFACCS